MKILVISQYYKPEQFKINDICEELVINGHDVTVLTGLPNYPEGKIYNGYKFFKNRREIINGVEVYRSFEIPRRKSVVFLALNYLSFLLSSSIKILFTKNKYDIIYVYQLSPVYSIFTGLIGKKKFKIPIFVYVCDIWPESLKNIIKSEKNLIYLFNKKFSSYLYNAADLLAVTSKPFIDYFETYHKINKNRIIYLPQHAEESLLNINRPKNNGVIDFMFMGNIGLAQDIECILNAVELIKDEKLFLMHFVGDGSFMQSAIKMVKDKNLENKVIFHGRHPFEKMSEFYDIADVCVLTLKSENLVGHTLPTKLQGYMAAGRPIVAAIDGAAKELIVNANCGYVGSAGDYKLLAKHMKLCVQDKTLQNLGVNGRNYFIKNFLLEKHIRILTESLTNII